MYYRMYYRAGETNQPRSWCFGDENNAALHDFENEGIRRCMTYSGCPLYHFRTYLALQFAQLLTLSSKGCQYEYNS